jgi:hypothetical protein
MPTDKSDYPKKRDGTKMVLITREYRHYLEPDSDPVKRKIAAGSTENGPAC